VIIIKPKRFPWNLEAIRLVTFSKNINRKTAKDIIFTVSEGAKKTQTRYYDGEIEKQMRL